MAISSPNRQNHLIWAWVSSTYGLQCGRSQDQHLTALDQRSWQPLQHVESKYAGDSLISSHRTSHQSVLIRGVGHIFRGKFTTIGGILWAGASELSYSATLRLNSQYRNSHMLVPQARYHQHAHRTDHPHTGKHNDKNIDSRGRCLRVVTPRRAFWNTNRTLSLLLQAEEILLTRSHTLVERLVLKGALCKEGRSFEVLVCVTLELTRSD